MKGLLKLALSGLIWSFLALAVQADTINVAMNGEEDLATNSEYAFIVGFRDYVSDKGFDVKVFPSDSLGKEKERLSQTSQALIQVNLASASTPASLSPMMRGILLPFMFKGAAEFDQVVAETDLLDQMNEPLLENGIRLVGFTQRGLDLGIWNTHVPIKSVEDLAGIRMRALNKGQVAFYEALGVKSTVVSWGEVANALQTGVVNGYVNPPNSALRTGHTQYLKHYTPAVLAPSMRAVVVSEDWYQGLTPEQREIVDAGVRAGLANNRQWVVDWASKVDARFKEDGVIVSELESGERDRMKTLAETVHGDILSSDDLKRYANAIAVVRK